jgi:acetate kinase
LGLKLDRIANARCKPDADIACGDSPARILVIATREDLTIVRETRRLIRSETETQQNVPTATNHNNN